MKGTRGLPAFLGTLFCLLSVGVTECVADLRPSADLRFVLSVDADTVTVGQPIPFRVSGAAPVHGTLLLPEFVDSIGPFSVLDVSPVSWSEEEMEGRRAFVQEGRLALFTTGEFESPRVPLLWVADGTGDEAPGTEEASDTLVAYTSPNRVIVRSVLPDELDLSDPQAALAELREVKGVVALRRNWTWLWIAGAGLLLAALGFWFWRRRGEALSPFPGAPRPQPQLAPDAAFLKGLELLQSRELLEHGEVKHYYAGLSLLLRGYLGGRFSIFAVEATQEEILPQILTAPNLAEDDRTFLRDWLAESDLVKYARLDRGQTEARDLTVSVEAWVRVTTEAARIREAEAAAAALAVASAPEKTVVESSVGGQG